MITPSQVKSIIRRHSAKSTFRRSGPGLNVKLRDALHAMNQEQREVALSYGYSRGQLYRGKTSGKLGVLRS